MRVPDDGSPQRSELLPLAWARVALGGVFLLRTTPLSAPLALRHVEGTAPLLGWPDGAWHGTPWLLALPELLVQAGCVVRTLVALAFTLGLYSRAAGVVACVSGYLVALQQPLELVGTLHVLLQGLLVLALVDSGCALALRPERPRAPASSRTLLCLFLAAIYCWAATVKMRGDWLDGRTLGLFYDHGALRGPVADLLLSSASLRAITAKGVVLIEVALPALLLHPRTRGAGVWAALAFHVCLDVVAQPDVFGWAMGALLLGLWPAARARAPLSG